MALVSPLDSYGLGHFDPAYGIRRGKIHVQLFDYTFYVANLTVAGVPADCPSWTFPTCSRFESNPWSAIIPQELLSDLQAQEGKEVVLDYVPVSRSEALKGLFYMFWFPEVVVARLLDSVFEHSACGMCA